MTEALIPLPLNHQEMIQTLFHVQSQIILTEQQYYVYWPLVDGVWSHTQTEKHKHLKSVSRYYVCRISKTRESSKPYSEENTSGKTRVTSFHPSGTCKMKIKICESLQDYKQKTFTILRVRHATDHDHDINESWNRKRSSFLQEIFRHELSKGYTPGEIKNRIKGAGRIAGYARLEAVGGAFVKRYGSSSSLIINITNIILEKILQILVENTSFQLPTYENYLLIYHFQTIGVWRFCF